MEIGEVGEEGGFGAECVWGERWEGGCLVRHDDGGSIWGEEGDRVGRWVL